jgi:hypothetical protein
VAFGVGDMATSRQLFGGGVACSALTAVGI